MMIDDGYDYDDGCDGDVLEGQSQQRKHVNVCN